MIVLNDRFDNHHQQRPVLIWKQYPENDKTGLRCHLLKKD
jgi:hypothetical protein